MSNEMYELNELKRLFKEADEELARMTYNNQKLEKALLEMKESNEVLKQEKQSLLTSINNVIAILLNTKKV